MTRTLFPDLDTEPVRKGATISGCGLYRYTLGRRWGDGPCVNFVMLNPSTADASVDDPTVARCSGFAKAWGYAGLVVTNLYALRATDPRELWTHPAPVGPDNDAHLEREAKAAARVVCAWGNGGSPVRRKSGWKRGRGWVVLHRLAAWGVEPHALKITAECMPAHPLYLPNGLTPKAWDQVPKPDVPWRPAGFDPEKDGDR